MLFAANSRWKRGSQPIIRDRTQLLYEKVGSIQLWCTCIAHKGRLTLGLLGPWGRTERPKRQVTQTLELLFVVNQAKDSRVKCEFVYGPLDLLYVSLSSCHTSRKVTM